MLRCFFGFHKWKYIWIYHYWDVSYSDEDDGGSPSYLATKRCEVCGKIDKDVVFQGGFPTLDQLNGIEQVIEVKETKLDLEKR